MLLWAGLWFLCGCLYTQAPRPAWLPPSLPAPGEAQPVSALWYWLLAGALLLAGVWFGLRRWRAKQEPGPLDRRETALLRTARDSLALLLKSRGKRLRVVWKQARGPGSAG